MASKTYKNAIDELKRYRFTSEDAFELCKMLMDSTVIDNTKQWIYEGYILDKDRPFDRLINKFVVEYIEATSRIPIQSYSYVDLVKKFRRNHTLSIIFYKPLEDLPLYINNDGRIYRHFAKWRLQIGK